MPIIFDLLDNVQDAAHPQAAPISALGNRTCHHCHCPQGHRCISTLGTRSRRHCRVHCRRLFRNLRYGTHFRGRLDRVSERRLARLRSEFWTDVLDASAWIHLCHPDWCNRNSWRLRSNSAHFVATATSRRLSFRSGSCGCRWGGQPAIRVRRHDSKHDVLDQRISNGTYRSGSSGSRDCCGHRLLILACFPKALAAILAIPSPVAAGYLAILVAMLFVVGMKVVVQDGIDYRKGMIAGVSFWVGGRLSERRDFP